MTSDILENNHLKLAQLFYYLQDISLELQADFAILSLVEATLQKRGLQTFVEFEGLITTTIQKGDPNVINTMSKVAFHNIILNICRFNEAVKKSGAGKLLKEFCPETQKRFQKFIDEYYTLDVKKYRDSYAVHPIDEKTGTFTSRSQLISLCEKIVKIDSLFKADISDFIRLLKRMHHTEVTDPDLSLAWAIHAMGPELEKHGVKLKRA